MTYYRQCRLEKKILPENITEESHESNYQLTDYEASLNIHHIVTYIPEKYAVKGSYIKLKNKDGEWSNGWQVMEVGTRLIEEALPDHHEDRKGFASLDRNAKKQ